MKGSVLVVILFTGLSTISLRSIAMTISKFIKSVLSSRYPDTSWNCSMSIKLVNYILRSDYCGSHYVALDDNNNQALYERDY